jgi:hypothetical protein
MKLMPMLSQTPSLISTDFFLAADIMKVSVKPIDCDKHSNTILVNHLFINKLSVFAYDGLSVWAE